MHKPSVRQAGTLRRLGVLPVLILVFTACTQAVDTTTTTTLTPSTTITENGRPMETVDCRNPPESVAIVCEAYDIILERYVDGAESAELALAAIEGLAQMEPADDDGLLVCAVPSQDFAATCDAAAPVGLDSEATAEAILESLIGNALDQNSGYINPAALARIQEGEQGSFGGIGALVSAEDHALEEENQQCSVISETCQLIIAGTMEGTPARESGLMPDDVVIEVDNESILGWPLDEVVSSVRGPAGSEVVLTVIRDDEQFQLTITRAIIQIPVIEYEMVGDTGYIRLFDFSEQGEVQFEEAILDLLTEGAASLVIDLRNNPGGLLDSAVGVASIFLPDGDVVVTQSPDSSQSYEVSGAMLVPEDMEVSFVVNRASASASEVVAAVLQERRRVTVLGENTFGKNTVQQRFNLSNGGALRLTTARWLTPDGLDFGGGGLDPDIELELGADVTAEEVVAAVKTTLTAQLSPG